jgi:hypothetical protein
MSSRVALVLLTVMIVGCSGVPRSFAPVDPLAPGAFSHQLFEDVLRAHVTDGVVNYPAIQHDARFGTYVRQLDQVDPNALPSREHRLAFWINAYNAFAIKGILDGYSPMTLWGRYKYFIGRAYQVGGQPINLYDLEQKLLIPDFREPRIHFAIVCASKSCPKLGTQTYTAERLGSQLDAAALAFVNDPIRNHFDRAKKVAYLSMIFKWFGADFAVQAGSLLTYVKRYVADQNLARELEAIPYRIEFLEYDWSLNGIPFSPSPSPLPRGGEG